MQLIPLSPSLLYSIPALHSLLWLFFYVHFFRPIIMMSRVSFLFLCTTLPQPWWLNTVPFISSQMCILAWARLCFMLKAKIMVLALLSRKESTLKVHSCWQNSALCGCRSKVPVSLLEVSHGPHSIPQGRHNPSHFTPFIFKQTMVQVLLRSMSLWLSYLLRARGSSLLL